MIESHPDNALEDLRLDQPFAEFKNHIESYDLESMDKKVCTSLVNAHSCINIVYGLYYAEFRQHVNFHSLFNL